VLGGRSEPLLLQLRPAGLHFRLAGGEASDAGGGEPSERAVSGLCQISTSRRGSRSTGGDTVDLLAHRASVRASMTARRRQSSRDPSTARRPHMCFVAADEVSLGSCAPTRSACCSSRSRSGSSSPWMPREGADADPQSGEHE